MRLTLNSGVFSMKRKAVQGLLMLTLAGSGTEIAYHPTAVPPSHLIKVIRTVDGPLKVFRSTVDCTVTFNDIYQQSVDLKVCSS